MFTKNKNCSGFSLIEVLVAAAVISLSVIAVIVMIRKGEEQVQLDKHRRAARGVIDRRIESSTFDPNNFNSFPAGAITYPTIVDTLDKKWATLLLCNLVITVGQVDSAQYAGTGIWVPKREVTFTATWTENGATESISINKWLTNVQH